MNREKSVDESWKESAAQEKERLETIARGGGDKSSMQRDPSAATRPSAGPRQASQPHDARDPAPEEPSGAHEADFMNYLSGLAYQTMVFLGEIPNPVTNTNEKNLEQAKFIIDTLILLQEKTKGNLTRKESDMLNTAAYELQMKFIEISQKETA